MQQKQLHVIGGEMTECQTTNHLWSIKIHKLYLCLDKKYTQSGRRQKQRSILPQSQVI